MPSISCTGDTHSEQGSGLLGLTARGGRRQRGRRRYSCVIARGRAALRPRGNLLLCEKNSSSVALPPLQRIIAWTRCAWRAIQWAVATEIVHYRQLVNDFVTFFPLDTTPIAVLH